MTTPHFLPPRIFRIALGLGGDELPLWLGEKGVSYFLRKLESFLSYNFFSLKDVKQREGAKRIQGPLSSRCFYLAVKSSVPHTWRLLGRWRGRGGLGETGPASPGEHSWCTAPLGRALFISIVCQALFL